MNNTEIIIKKLEDLTQTMVGHKDLHKARFKIFEAINILRKFEDDKRLPVFRNRSGGRS